MPDNTLSTLEDIRIKVRRLTRSPSSSQISDSTINDYVNTFILYDFPEALRLSYLRTTLTFYTQPYIDIYSTNTANPDDPLFNFKNKYMTVHDPVYIAGYKSFYTQSREQFYNIYPFTNNIVTLTTGNGVATNFTGTLSAHPMLIGKVTFSSVDTVNNGLVLRDNQLGQLVVPDSTATVPPSTINYLTGAYVLNFPTPPANGVKIIAMTVPYQTSRPNAICFYQDSFIVRPVPDQSYPVNLEVYQRPTELLQNSDMPELSEWWQYIAYGAAKKILEDRMDPDTVAMITPEFKNQETRILRRSIIQQSNERVATIYTEQASIGTGFNWGGSNF